MVIARLIEIFLSASECWLYELKVHGIRERQWRNQRFLKRWVDWGSTLLRFNYIEWYSGSPHGPGGPLMVHLGFLVVHKEFQD